MAATAGWADLAFLFLLALIWGTSFLWIKVSLRGFTPVHNTVLRLSLGAGVLLAYSAIKGVRLPRDRQVWLHLAVMASMANVTPFFLFAFAETTVDSAIAGVLNATTPLWTAAVAAIAGTERFNSPKLLGLALGFGGAVLIFEPWTSGSRAMTLGGVACLVASACYGLGFVYAAHFLAGRGLKPLSLSAAQLTAAALLSTLLLPFGGSAPPLRMDAWIAIAILGVLGTGIAYVINYRLIVNRGASGAALVTYLIPVVAVTVGAATLNERITLNVIGGAAVVLIGVALIRTSRA